MKTIVCVFCLMVLVGSAAFAAEKKPFHVKGEFIDGCSCAIPCNCSIGGLEHGCQGVGAMLISSGEYAGVSLAGAKIAYATSPGTWVRGYVETRDPAQQKAAEAFARAALSAFGKVEFVKPARVDVTGKSGNYKLAVNNGRTIKLATKPILGGDKRTPVAHTNLNDPMNSMFYQAKTISGSYSDENRAFGLKDSNSYFNDRLDKSGKM